MNLLSNPFGLLGANEFSKRSEVMELVDLMSLSLDEQECNEARLTLFTPSKRLEAEVGWIYTFYASSTKSTNGSRHPSANTSTNSAAEPFIKADELEQDQVQNLLHKISEFIDLARTWQQSYNIPSYTALCSTKSALSNQIVRISQYLENDEEDTEKCTFDLFPPCCSYPYQVVDLQNEPLSQQLQVLGWEIFEHLSKVKDHWAELSKINLLSLMLECSLVYPVDFVPSVKSRDIVFELMRAFEALEISQVLQVINRARQIAGITLLSDESLLQDALNERRFQVIHLVNAKLSQLSHVEQAQYLSHLIFLINRNNLGELVNSTLLSELLKLYTMQCNEFFKLALTLQTSRDFARVGEIRCYQNNSLWGMLFSRKLYACEQPFMALRLAWWLDFDLPQVKSALDEVCRISLAWLARLQPVIDWTLLNKQDVEEIESLAVLYNMWEMLLSDIYHASCVYPYVQELCDFGLQLFARCGSYKSKFEGRLSFIAFNCPLLKFGKQHRGDLLLQAKALDPGNLQQKTDVEVYSHMLIAGSYQVSLSDVALMHYEYRYNCETLVLKDKQLHELIALPFKKHNEFKKVVDIVAQRLLAIRFLLKLRVLRFFKSRNSEIADSFDVICSRHANPFGEVESEARSGNIKYINKGTFLTVELLAEQSHQPVSLAFSTNDNLPIYAHYLMSDKFDNYEGLYPSDPQTFDGNPEF